MTKTYDATAAKNVTLGLTLRAAQKVIQKRLTENRFVTAICHRRLGKTLFGVDYLIKEALDPSVEDFRGYYFGATQKAAKQVAWHYFKKILAPMSKNGEVVFKETELQVQFSNGSWITLAGSENIEAYRGIYIDRIVADEVASWSNATYAWQEVLRPAMSDRMARGLIIGTVKGLDMLYEFYMRGISPEVEDSEYGAVKLPASITGIIPDTELAELKRTMSEEAYERELECNFFAESPDVLISPKEANDAQRRTLSFAQRQSSLAVRPVLGVDVGRTGDPSVVYMRQGLIITKLLSTQDPDNMSVADRVSRLIKTHRPQSVFVDAGHGQGVIDRLYRLGHDDCVVEIPFNGVSPEKSCVNMRAAMYYRVKKFLAKGTIPEDQLLLKELVNQELLDEPNNRIKLARKVVIKARINNKSCNDSDACALLFADESVDDIDDPAVRRERAMHEYMEAAGFPSVRPEDTYDPLDYMDSYSGTNFY